MCHRSRLKVAVVHSCGRTRRYRPSPTHGYHMRPTGRRYFTRFRPVVHRATRHPQAEPRRALPGIRCRWTVRHSGNEEEIVANIRSPQAQFTRRGHQSSIAGSEGVRQCADCTMLTGWSVATTVARGVPAAQRIPLTAATVDSCPRVWRIGQRHHRSRRVGCTRLCR